MAQAHSTPDAEERLRLLCHVVIVNRRVAQAVANRYRRRGVSDDDLEQVAYEGLVKAVQRFDPQLRHDLLSYAVPTIRGEVQKHFRDLGWVVRPPRRIQDLQWTVTTSRDSLCAELGHEPSAAEIQERAGISPDDYAESLAAVGCFTPTSFSQTVPGTDGLTLGDSMLDTRSGADHIEDGLEVRRAMATLGRRDRTIVFMRFYEDRTLREIALTLGISEARVSLRLARGLDTLRRHLERPSSTAR